MVKTKVIEKIFIINANALMEWNMLGEKVRYLFVWINPKVVLIDSALMLIIYNSD